eukprot:597728-Amphidinium_carterae.1
MPQNAHSFRGLKEVAGLAGGQGACASQLIKRQLLHPRMLSKCQANKTKDDWAPRLMQKLHTLGAPPTYSPILVGPAKTPAQLRTEIIWSVAPCAARYETDMAADMSAATHLSQRPQLLRLARFALTCIRCHDNMTSSGA